MKLALTTIGSPFKYVSGGAAQADVATIINNALPYVFGAAALLLLIYLVMAGLQMMTSQGDPKAMQSAQAKITNALIGFVIVIFAFALVSIIGRVFGVSVFGLIFK